jgi:hypothetical protein
VILTGAVALVGAGTSLSRPRFASSGRRSPPLPRSRPRPGNAPGALSSSQAPHPSRGNASHRLVRGGPTRVNTGTPVRPFRAMVRSALAPASDTQNAPAPPLPLPGGRAGVARGSLLCHPFCWGPPIARSPCRWSQSSHVSSQPGHARTPRTTATGEAHVEPSPQYSVPAGGCFRGYRETTCRSTKRAFAGRSAMRRAK